MTAVLVLQVGDCMESSAAISRDILATANRISRAAGRAAPFEVQTAACGTGDGLPGADLIIVPGLGAPSEAELAAVLAGPEGRRAAGLLTTASQGGAALAASCASVFLLAEAGLLDGRRATTTWWLAPLFRRRYPAVHLAPDLIVAPDWPIATAGAAMAQMDLMLAVVARFAGPGLARACAGYLLLDERRSQTPFMALGALARQDPQVARAEAWACDNLHRDFTAEDLAAAAGLSPRTFARRVTAVCGLSPIRFVQSLRVEAARTLLETTRLPVDEIARRVGYAEPSTLRRLMRRELKQPPGAFRTQAPPGPRGG